MSRERGLTSILCDPYCYVVPDCIEPDNPYPRECYDSELRPVLDDTAPGWVPYRFWANCPTLQLARTTTYDVQLHNGAWAFECFAKAQPTCGYQFVIPTAATSTTR